MLVTHPGVYIQNFGLLDVDILKKNLKEERRHNWFRGELSSSLHLQQL